MLRTNRYLKLMGDGMKTRHLFISLVVGQTEYSYNLHSTEIVFSLFVTGQCSNFPQQTFIAYRYVMSYQTSKHRVGTWYKAFILQLRPSEDSLLTDDWNILESWSKAEQKSISG
jgi:hypothetical protein